MNLKGFDLNLLVAFNTLMSERKVSKAAERLFVSQSAMSHSLNRLREQLNDPLLVATKGGMMPTARALALEQPVKEWLAAVEVGLSAMDNFDPASSSHQFVLGTTDYLEYAFLPPLMERINRQAPGVDVALKRVPPGELTEAMARGDIDATIQLFDPEPERGLLTRQVAVEEPVVLLRDDHPEVPQHQLSLEQYLQLSHLDVASMELSTEVSHLLREKGLARRIQLQVPSFMSAPIILAESDMLATLPTYIARRFIHGGRLKIADLPLELGLFPVNMCWHRLRDQDPAQQWLRQQLIAVGEELVAQRQIEGRGKL